MKVRKLPIVVDAWIISTTIDVTFTPNWVLKALTENRLIFEERPLGKIIWKIKSLEGWMHAETGSVLIRGVEGELWAVQKTIFDKTYEVVNEQKISK